MKYLIVGLGNIGAEYAGTRHNIGFNVLDALAEASNAVFTTARYGDVAQVKHKGRTLILLKPSTYMNLSGKAVGYWMEAEKIAPENLLVVSVLGEWSEEDRKAMPERLKVFCDAILSFATIGVERTMNFFNKK